RAAGTFAWRRAARVRVLDDLAFGDVDVVAAEHDGYRRDLGVVHRRRVLFAHPEYWLVADDFRGSGAHTFEVRYHLAAGTACSADASRGADDARALHAPPRYDLKLGDAGAIVAFFASTPFEVEHLLARPERRDGWLSPRYGERVAGATLT